MCENFTNMLIRVIIDNVLSFGKEREFNMLPRKSLQTLQHHKYPITINGNKVEGLEVLKMAAVYGANGSGKSNLIHALNILSHLVTEGEILSKLKNGQFKFQENREQTPQQISVEFVQDETAFYYAVEVTNGQITGEELYILGFEKEDTLIYTRGIDKNGEDILLFNDEFEKMLETKILKSILLKSMIKSDSSILKIISELNYPFLKEAKNAFKWFSNSLLIVFPNLIPETLISNLEIPKFRHFVNQIISEIGVGIENIFVLNEKMNIKNKKLMQLIEMNPKQIVLNEDHTIMIAKIGEEYFSKKIQLQHSSDDMFATFDIEEESDGTRKLLDLMVLFYGIIFQNRVAFIDEMERSLHPLLVKKLVELFSQDTQTNGQLIFTTHESHLLDQEIFRTDEIWFAEKDLSGATDLYALSAYKPHKTKDIETAYLAGRYGAIPFLGDLKSFEHSEEQVIDKEKNSTTRQNSAE